MNRRSLSGVAGALVLAACSTTPAPSGSPAVTASPSAAPTTFSFGREEAASELPPADPILEGIPGPGGGTVLGPVSLSITHGEPYRFSLGHCGLLSPVDVDGSFWDAVAGVGPDGSRIDLANDGEMINATSGVLLVIGDEALFRTQSGTVVSFERHDGEKEFPTCL